MTVEPTFAALIQSIRQVHDELAAQASKAINLSLTLRNWLIGHYIAEYELKGRDRADYGTSLLEKVAEALKEAQVSTCGKRQLYWYLRFYQTYPQIVRSLPAQFQRLPGFPSTALERLSSDIVRSAPPQSPLDSQRLVSSLSYSHFEHLIAIEDPTKRAFYELECIRGNWSIRELKRQIESLYYERSGLSHNKSKLSELTHHVAGTPSALDIRDPYVFEFLGLKPTEVMSESHLENELIHNLQEFMLELGHGFCFEAQQKRILLGDEHFFIDLVFYHRILKCHVLVELKLEAFNHNNLGQLNTYVNWYRQNMMTPGDNPPVGLLLCTHKNHALVEYALAGMDNQLFISKYQLELPPKEQMQAFLDSQLKSMGDNPARGKESLSRT